MSTRGFSVVGIGGTLSPDSSSEQALKIALRALAANGASTTLFSGLQLVAAPYGSAPAENNEAMTKLVAALRKADAIILSSPCYHGGVSGLIKNAIDYTEEMRTDARPYFHGRVVGCIATGAGNQGPGMVLSSLRNIVHALRGWPAPLGVGINTAKVKFFNGSCSDPAVTTQLETMADQIAEFVGMTSAAPALSSAS